LGFGFSVGDIKKGACFRYFGKVCPALGAKPTSHFLAQISLETRLYSASLENLIGFVAYLEQKLWQNKTFFSIIQTFLLNMICCLRANFGQP